MHVVFPVVYYFPGLGRTYPCLCIRYSLYTLVATFSKGKTSTYDHRVWRTGLPVRSAVLKPHAGRLVVGWVTTSESRLLRSKVGINSGTPQTRRVSTAAYQRETEEQDNVVCLKQRAPATEATYSRANENWCLWRLSRDENESKNSAKEEPDPSAQTLKLFAEDFVATRKQIPSQYSVRHTISCFVAEWERKTGRTHPKHLKNDVYNVGHESRA
ncbi:hypothetical protein ACHE_60062S, partial [Aspergillus chevalieri]